MVRKGILLVAGLVMSLSSLGCSWETGARNGVQDGMSAAIATLITAPVQAWVDQVFGD